MSIGAGVLIFVIGAILRFAVTIQLAWIDLPLVGNILMGAGIVVFVLALVFTFRRRRTTSTRRSVVAHEDGRNSMRRTTETDDTEP